MLNITSTKSAIKIFQFAQKRCCPKLAAKFENQKFEVFLDKKAMYWRSMYQQWRKIMKFRSSLTNPSFKAIHPRSPSIAPQSSVKVEICPIIPALPVPVHDYSNRKKYHFLLNKFSSTCNLNPYLNHLNRTREISIKNSWNDLEI